ncbi:hypothetical protein JVT61DRAFT_8002 [Boletus reticuloceps]|uniref:Uncharacterized protein n=1 Tax=Boletus reticuloceps TaxID=495285 RepID=A0A8I2YHV2_9AGAM|nr:hypothetical protein JVT61DRAFT_8002 [Boletus reticuloceps]
MPFDDSSQWFPPTTVQPSALHAPLPSGHPYETLMPPYNQEAPGELLVRYHGDRRHVPDWTEPRGEFRNLWELFLLHRSIVRAIGSQGSVGNRERPNGPSAKPVPVALYYVGPVLDRPQTTVIEFKDRDQSAPSKGIHLALLAGKSLDPARLQGARDIVLGELKRSGLELIIAWPGYRPVRFEARTVSADGGPLTRFDLGQQIVFAYALFFRKVEEERLISSMADYHIALYQGPRARTDTPGIQFMQLHLVRIRKTRCWVADIEIV